MKDKGTIQEMNLNGVKPSKNMIVSFSGGRTSGYMVHLLMTMPMFADYTKTLVFANTGKEREETYDFVRDLEINFDIKVHWVEAVSQMFIAKYSKGKEREIYYFADSQMWEPSGIMSAAKDIGTGYRMVNFETANRTGIPFEGVMSKYGFSNQHAPLCTRELKAVPIRKFAKDKFNNDYIMPIGIRADEKTRVNLLRAAKFRWVYPLVYDVPTTKNHVAAFWRKQSFNLQLESHQGNCDMCWKKGQRMRIRIINEDPDITEWWNEMEIKYGEGQVFDRDGYSIEQLKKLANTQPVSFFADDPGACSCFANVT